MIEARYYDGLTARTRLVCLSIEDGNLRVSGEGIERSSLISALRISERLGSAPRLIHFADGGFCEVRDLEGLSALLTQAGHQDGWVDRLQRHLPLVLACLAGCIVLAVSAYLWGLPWVTSVVARKLPAEIQQSIGAQTLRALDQSVLKPSRVDPSRQQAIRSRYLHLRLPEGGPQTASLLFRAAPGIGANAFTLPDGSIVVLDELVGLLNDEQLIAVLCHELGHSQNQHSFRLILERSILAAVWMAYVGDVSSVLAAAPVAVLQTRYSRGFEQEADDYAAKVLQANGMSPILLVDVLQKLEAQRKAIGVPHYAYLSTHPSSEERIRRLRALSSASAAVVH